MNIINKKCVSTIIGGISGNVTYNGKTINIPRGSRFEMIDGKVLINGKPFEQYNEADSDIDKIQQAGISKTQQYKLAGNSIVVSCLYHVFRKMFIDHSNEQKGYVQLSLF